MRLRASFKTRKTRVRTGVSCLLAAAALSGCVNLNDYGTVAPYHRESPMKIPVALPVTAPAISNQFLEVSRDGDKGHLGLDIAAPVGTPVLAAAAGRVYLSYHEPMYGNRIILDHGLGTDGRRSFTVYKHLDTRVVADGTPVTRGQQIGTLGETGLLSSYPHLHFEVMREKAPGRRVLGGANWWQGMMQEDPNLFWAAGPGRPTCANTGPVVTGGQGMLPITYPAACRG
ncbi:MAG: M23 family metallopeptidase [Maritimibacter sp.]|nr:M23 family metallopeptidase [Maritimibacter sp.]